MSPPSSGHEARSPQLTGRWLLQIHWSFSTWLVLIVGMIALVPFGIRGFFLSHVPAMADPFDIAAFVGDPVPDAENSFDQYQQVIKMLHRIESSASSNTAPKNLLQTEVLDWNPNDEEMRAWLDKHRQALAVWLRATERSRAQSYDPTKISLTTPILHHLKLHTMAQTAMAEQARLLYEGNVDEAWKLVRATLRCGGHVGWHSTQLNGLLGMTIHEAAFGGIRRWAEHPSVTADQLRSALNDIKSDFQLYDTESGLIKLEFIAVRHALRQKSVLLDMANTGMVALYPTPVLQYGNAALLWLKGEPDLTQRLLTQVASNQLREIDKSLAERRRLITPAPTLLFDSEGVTNRAEGELTGTQIQSALLLSSICPLITNSRKLYDQSYLALLARQTVLETLLALHIHRQEKGEFPERLEELIPQFFVTAPRDPCHLANNPLIYKRQSADRATLYSVGSNGVDDEGTLGGNNRSPDIGVVLSGSH